MRRLALVLLATGCAAPQGGGGDDDDASEPTPDPRIHCRGDTPQDEVPLSTDMAALEDRFTVNKELLRILFLGEPY